MFDYERDMIEPAAQWLSKQGLMVKAEFPTPWGICDLVGCALNRHKVRKRLSLRQTRPIRSPLRVHLLSLIPDETDQRTVGVEELHVGFGGYVNRERIETELGRLFRDRFVEQPSPAAYFKRNGWMPLHKRLVAVELKLSRIDDALHQAINNLGFADESYVGLPPDRARRLVVSKRRSEFDYSGIGILAVSTCRCTVVLRPQRQSPTVQRTTQVYSVECFWPSALKDNEA